MTTSSSPIIFLSGAGGGAPDLPRLEVIGYPGWKRYVAAGFSAEVLIANLVEEIAIRVPSGPIRIAGYSIGGHLGYAVALRLQAMGREIAGFCAIDTFMIASFEPSAGWKGRALAQGLELLRGRRFVELARFVRSKFWRGLFRLAGSRLTSLLQKVSTSSRLAWDSAFDPIFENELSMRLLIQTVAPWIASLDREPVPLKAPAILLRTELTASDDSAWRRRCPNIEIFQIRGEHHTLFDAENIGSFRDVFVAATQGWR